MELKANEPDRRRIEEAQECAEARYTRGVLAIYAEHVTSASFGAVTDADLKL